MGFDPPSHNERKFPAGLLAKRPPRVGLIIAVARRFQYNQAPSGGPSGLDPPYVYYIYANLGAYAFIVVFPPRLLRGFVTFSFLERR
jgi:hypothetical protein